MAKVKILIADDHPLFLEGITSLLKTEKEFNISATATNGKEAWELIQKNEFDICVLDINMPEMNGMELAKKIKQANILTKVVMLTTHNDKEFISEMLMSGVSGYILKSATKNELIQAIKKINSGGTYFSSEVYDSIVNNYVEQGKTDKQTPQAILTAREIEIVELLAKEYTNEKIADKLNISFRTVETHRKNIMHKTKAKNLAGLLKFAYENDILK